jgi:hypothetical protein|eukprot:TRINITY_DN8136_c0_g1_i1.p1 TRINITY_DN8136_c0_g1~~TRINITY_DN8136_c0_g1_i1.p1  ORF type:complete len:539 (-),score=81.21 TRINITY_DN8136_c0_g1_i1:52-1668(-)
MHFFHGAFLACGALALQSSGSAESLSLIQAAPNGFQDARNPVRRHPHKIAAGSRLHFLFLLKDDTPLPTFSVWRAFFSVAPPDSFRVLGHCSEECDRGKLKALLPAMTLIEKVPSSYCMDVVTPMAALLKAALPHASVHQQSMDKFIFVSASTLPTKPFPVLFRGLTRIADSDICIIAPDDWASATLDGKRFRIVKHSQWVVLNKPHAKRFIKFWAPNSEQHDRARQSRWLINTPLGHAVPRETFTGAVGTPGAHCTDEEAVFAALFGAIEEVDGSELSREYNRFGRVQLGERLPRQAVMGRCHTYVAWDINPGSLAGFIHKDEGSDIPAARDLNDFSHPLEFKKLSNRSLAAVRVHPSLFIRKISDDADLSSYASIVLGEHVKSFSGYNVRIPGHIRLKSVSAEEADRCLGVEAENETLVLRWSECNPGSPSSRFWAPESGVGLIRFGHFFDRCLAAQSSDAPTGSWIVLIECDKAERNQTRFIIPSDASSSIGWAARPGDCLDSVASDAGALRLSKCDEANIVQPPRLSYDLRDLY